MNNNQNYFYVSSHTISQPHQNLVPFTFQTPIIPFYGISPCIETRQEEAITSIFASSYHNYNHHHHHHNHTVSTFNQSI